MKMQNKRVVLADDHAVFRQGLVTLLKPSGIDVVGEAGDGGEALRMVCDIRPDVAVLDLSMPVMNGLDVVRELTRIDPGIRTILLTMHADDVYVLEALRVGVWGYVLKSQAAADVVAAIKQVANDTVYLSPGVSQAVVRASRSKLGLRSETLTVRERQILQLISDGKTTKEIASELSVSTKTIESHRARMMKKLDIHSTARLVRYAVRRGFVEA